MKPAKSYIIWMPESGSGKSRQIYINPWYLAALAITLALCVLLIPVFQTYIRGLNQKIAALENERAAQNSEITSLKYLEKNLERIEKKDRQLSEYFGVGHSPEELDALLGQGGSDELKDNENYIENVESASLGSLPTHLDNIESKFENYEKLFIAREEIQDHTPNIIPLEKKGISLSSEFGWRVNPFTKRKEFHAAIDISGRMGTGILSPAKGTVIKAGHDKRLGNFIVLKHSEQIKTIYGHLSRILVKEGDEVLRAEKIGLMGNSGLSTSSHLHYMIVKGDRAVNPLEYILDAGYIL